MSRALRAWKASFTRRWHTNFDLCDTVDYDSGHQGRVALLVLSLFPDASRDLLVAALTHDQGESAVGDFSYTVKVSEPVLADILSGMEADARALQGFDEIHLHADDWRRMKLCDWLDAWLWMMRHRPALHTRADWVAQADNSLETAKTLGVGMAVQEIMREAIGS